MEPEDDSGYGGGTGMKIKIVEIVLGKALDLAWKKKPSLVQAKMQITVTDIGKPDMPHEHRARVEITPKFVPLDVERLWIRRVGAPDREYSIEPGSLVDPTGGSPLAFDTPMPANKPETFGILLGNVQRQIVEDRNRPHGKRGDLSYGHSVAVVLVIEAAKQREHCSEPFELPLPASSPPTGPPPGLRR